MRSSPSGSLARTIALPYLAVFLSVLAIFAAGVHGAVVVLAQRESQVRLNALVHAGVAAVDVDDHGRVDDRLVPLVNPKEQGVEWFTSSGRPIAERGLIPQRPAPLSAGSMQRYATSQGWVNVETVPVLAKDGRTVGYVRATQSDERAEDTIRWVDLGLAVGFLLAGTTSIAGGLYLSRKTVERIAENMRLLEDFSADAAHELRTPLAAISSNADASLRAGGLSPEHRRRFETIAGTAAGMHRLSDDLLTLAMPRTITATELQHIDVAEIAASAVTARIAEAESRGVRLTVRADGAAQLLGNVEQVRRIITNLADNAIRYTERGGEITVHIRASHDQVWVSVRDTGIGIAPEDRAKIFQRFWRADRARRVGGGSGLGLAIVDALVRRHGGTIRVEGAPGRGSEFIVSLPQRPPK